MLGDRVLDGGASSSSSFMLLFLLVMLFMLFMLFLLLSMLFLLFLLFCCSCCPWCCCSGFGWRCVVVGATLDSLLPLCRTTLLGRP